MWLFIPLAFGLFWWARKKGISLSQEPLTHVWPTLTHPSLVNGNHYFFAIKFKANPTPANIRTVLSSMFSNLVVMFPKAATTTPPSPRPDDWAGFLDKGYAIGFGQWTGEANGKIEALTMAPVGYDTTAPIVYWKSTEDYMKNTIDTVASKQ